MRISTAMIGRTARDSRKMNAAKARADSRADQTADRAHVFARPEIDLALTVARQLGWAIERIKSEAVRQQIEPGGLGELLGGAAAGTALSGGLGALIKEFQQRGLGQAAQSWVGTGPNQMIASNDLARALGTDTIDALSKQTGVGREDLLAGLSQHLPNLVDQLTPNGRLPSAEEASRMV